MGESCEEWLARLRRSISGANAPGVVSERPAADRIDRRETLNLMTVEEFHRKCVAVVRIVSRGNRG
ncbi:MAG: hypothetical protein OXU64_02970 [Gemmatimonadota bacterium]|nr:hypothetical protein [Gemmatimonadota bacterium]